MLLHQLVAQVEFQRMPRQDLEVETQAYPRVVVEVEPEQQAVEVEMVGVV